MNADRVIHFLIVLSILGILLALAISAPRL